MTIFNQRDCDLNIQNHYNSCNTQPHKYHGYRVGQSRQQVPSDSPPRTPSLSTIMAWSLLVPVNINNTKENQYHPSSTPTGRSNSINYSFPSLPTHSCCSLHQLQNAIFNQSTPTVSQTQEQRQQTYSYRLAYKALAVLTWKDIISGTIFSNLHPTASWEYLHQQNGSNS